MIGMTLMVGDTEVYVSVVVKNFAIEEEHFEVA